MQRVPIRIRLTLLSTATMAAGLAVICAALYASLGWSLDEAYRDELNHRFSSVAAVVETEGPGGLLEYRSLLGGGAPGLPAEEFAQVLTLSGSVLQTPDGVPASILPSTGLQAAREGGFGGDLPSSPGHPGFRLLAGRVEAPSGQVLVLAARSLDDRAEAMKGMLTQFVLWAPVVLLLSAALAYQLAAAALRPVEAMRSEAAQIQAANLEAHLPVPPADDEIARLGATLNQMLDRLKSGIERERAFLADASHELRTPLSLLKAELDLALRRPRSQEELQRAVESAAEETDRLVQLADDLLVLARVDQGRLPLRLGAVKVSRLLESLVEGFRGRAERHERTIRTSCREELWIKADETRLEQALRNLLENALRYGAGDVEVLAEETEGEVKFHVQDEGPGFPPTFLPRAFQRFARPDSDRVGQGSGLGLAIARAIAEAHGGRAGAENLPGGGANVWIGLPANPA